MPPSANDRPGCSPSLRLRPDAPEELASALRAADQSGTRIENPDLSGLARILEHAPEDMTVIVEAGCTLAALQQALAGRGQWLPIDPPHPDQLTMAALLDTNASGPRRCGHGTIREHLIGLRVALADGRLIRSGGRVVKNVAGYDLLKLFIGAQGTLGIIVEATFKLLPRPEAEAFVQRRCASLAEADAALSTVLDSELTPTVLDLHNLPTASAPATSPDATRSIISIVAGFSGARAAVDWQLDRAARLGFQEPANLEHDPGLHSPDLPAPQRLSVLPSRLIETLHGLEQSPFVARAAQGVIYHRAPHRPDASGPESPATLELMRRVKDVFDPHRIFPEMPL